MARLASEDPAFVILDRYPAGQDHTLLLPERLVSSWCGATETEQGGLLALAEQVEAILEDRSAPDGWGLEVNVGLAAGRTVDYLHVLARYDGDVTDPRGGIRHAVLAKGDQQKTGTGPAAGDDGPPQSTGVRPFDGLRRPLGRLTTALLHDSAYHHLDVAVAFALPSGTAPAAGPDRQPPGVPGPPPAAARRS
ncbi:MAG: HIT family protein [Nitriliruptor sp.]|nr:MAG: HIT family protein [Nitriliruptor sp.]